MLKALVELEPDVERAPLQPPDAVQPVAFVDDQVSVAASPLATLVGVAVSVTVGARGAGVPGSSVAPPPPHATSAMARSMTLMRFDERRGQRVFTDPPDSNERNRGALNSAIGR